MKNKGKKKNKVLKIFLIIIATILALIAISHTTITIKTFVNYDYNVKVWKEYNHTGIINNQWDFKKLKYGFGNVGANGCGAVSVYNILQMEGKNPDFPLIIKQFDLCGENVFGIAGSKPSRVIKVLKKYGFNVSYSANKSKFEDIAKNSKYSIYVYFGIKDFVPFGHYQLIYNFDGEKFDTINITGKYTYKEITDIDNTFFTMMIGINV